MQTFLLVSSDSVFLEQEIKKIIKTHQISPFNYQTITPSLSLGIDEVKKIKESLMLKPFTYGKRLIVIKDIDKATKEAENALLKVLEEPPPETIIVLTASSADVLLETIVSRCQVVKEKTTRKIDKTKLEETKQFLEKILFSSPAQRLLLIQDLNPKKEEAKKILEDLLDLLENSLYSQSLKLSYPTILVLIKKISAAIAYLEKNVQPRAVLDVLFLGFPKISP